jgi:hypothetical protein
LNLKNPTIVTSAAGEYVNTNGSSNLMGLNYGTCIGSDCCVDPLVYDPDNNVCAEPKVTTALNSFTTMELAYNTDLITKVNPSSSGIILANTPYELEQYAIYN